MKLDINIEVTPGRPKSRDIKRAIIPSLKEVKMANPAVITRKVSSLLGRRVCRITVYKYLEELVDEKQIKKHVVSKGKKRTISVYSL